MEKLIKVLTDPVSNKILQMIRVKKQMSISDILSGNSGIPRATLYRKVEKMLEVGAIYVAETRKVRGQVENIYAIKDISHDKRHKAVCPDKRQKQKQSSFADCSWRSGWLFSRNLQCCSKRLGG